MLPEVCSWGGGSSGKAASKAGKAGSKSLGGWAEAGPGGAGLLGGTLEGAALKPAPLPLELGGPLADSSSSS